MNLEQLKTLAAELIAKLQGLTEKTDLTADEVTEMQAAAAKLTETQKSIEVFKAAQAALAAATVPANAPALQRGTTVPAGVATPLSTAEKIGLIAMATAESTLLQRGRKFVEPYTILEQRGFQSFVDEHRASEAKLIEVQRTLNISNAGQGGILVPEAVVGDFIDLLRPESAFFQGNPRRVDLSTGTYRAPAGVTGAQATYRAEGSRIAVTEPSFGAVEMSVKFLGAIVPMTKQFIQFTPAGAKAWVERDLRAAMAEEIDTAGFYGSGAVGEPLGVLQRPSIINMPNASWDTIANATAPTLAQIDTVMAAMVRQFTDRYRNNMGNWKWLMNPALVQVIGRKRVGDNSNGDFAYPEMRGMNPSFLGIPVLQTTKVPTNLGGGADETQIALLDFNEILYGEQQGLVVTTSDESTIFYNGQWVSAFQNDLVFMRATHAHDFGVNRAQAAVVLNEVKWGNP
jgi:HK97 family phage major capsid protein